MEPRLNIDKGDFNRFMFDSTFGFPCCENLLSLNTAGVFWMVYGINIYLYYVTVENGQCDPQQLCLKWVNEVKHESDILLQATMDVTTTSASPTTISTNTPTVTAITTPKPDIILTLT